MNRLLRSEIPCSSLSSGFDDDESEDTEADRWKHERLREERCPECITSHVPQEGKECDPTEWEIQPRINCTIDSFWTLFDEGLGESHNEHCSPPRCSDRVPTPT